MYQEASLRYVYLPDMTLICVQMRQTGIPGTCCSFRTSKSVEAASRQTILEMTHPEAPLLPSNLSRISSFLSCLFQVES